MLHVWIDVNEKINADHSIMKGFSGQLLYSHKLHGCLCTDILRRRYALITIRFNDLLTRLCIVTLLFALTS